jgi:hypothetical protein
MHDCHFSEMNCNGKVLNQTVWYLQAAELSGSWLRFSRSPD